MAPVLSPPERDTIFHHCREGDYQDMLLLSTVAALLTLAVTTVQPLLHPAYHAPKKKLGVSVTGLYLKVANPQRPVITELVRCEAERMAAALKSCGLPCQPLVPAYRTLILDASDLAATGHRLKETRQQRGLPLPGYGLVVRHADRRPADVQPAGGGHGGPGCCAWGGARWQAGFHV
ncbi:MAG: hypothetical protein K6T86_14235 [Pirellulales bacterium]|nr:hypothetical protein [Pirellulales bacterium]